MGGARSGWVGWMLLAVVCLALAGCATHTSGPGLRDVRAVPVDDTPALM